MFCFCPPVFPGAVHRRHGVASAQRGPPDRHHEHETGPGAQVPRRARSEAGQLRGVHALRALSRRRRPAQSRPGAPVVRLVLNTRRRSGPPCNPKVRPPLTLETHTHTPKLAETVFLSEKVRPKRPSNLYTILKYYKYCVQCDG